MAENICPTVSCPMGWWGQLGGEEGGGRLLEKEGAGNLEPGAASHPSSFRGGAVMERGVDWFLPLKSPLRPGIYCSLRKTLPLARKKFLVPLEKVGP